MSWWGHVAVVEAVSPDGTMIKYSDMNGLSGFGRVGYSDWVPATTYQNYIYR
jgi:surface antigen